MSSEFGATMGKLMWRAACTSLAEKCDHEEVGKMAELGSLLDVWCPICGSVKIGKGWVEPVWLLQLKAAKK